MSYIRSSALGGDGIMFARLFFLIEFAFVIAVLREGKSSRAAHCPSVTESPPRSHFLENLQSLGVTANAGQVLIYEDRSGSTVGTGRNICNNSCTRRASCVEETHNSPKMKVPRSVPGLLSAAHTHTPPCCAFTRV